jgi:hypothetical protein
MSNAQLNPNSQNPKTNDLVIGIWDFIGPWDLVIGAS